MRSTISERLGTIRWCFAAIAWLGLLFIGYGLVIVPMLPATQLDRVLTPDQLRDHAIREETLATLNRETGNQWAAWAMAGITVTAIGAAGFRLAREGRIE